LLPVCPEVPLFIFLICIQILMYLRMCLAHSAGLQPEVVSTASMQLQAPRIGQYVQRLIAEKGCQSGPIAAYVNIAHQLVAALNGMIGLCS
jgi:proteasome component ECM29